MTRSFYACFAAGLLAAIVLGVCSGLYAFLLDGKYVTHGLANLACFQFVGAFDALAIPALLIGLIAGALRPPASHMRGMSRGRAGLFVAVGVVILVIVLAGMRRRGADIPWFSLEGGAIRLTVPVRVVAGVVFGAFCLGILVIAFRRTRALQWPRGRGLIAAGLLVLVATNATAGILHAVLRHAARRAPAVVLISIDTLRADHLGCYGYPRDTTPHIDSLAAHATRFETVIVPMTHTLPSHVSMLTGLNPKTHGVRMNGMRLRSDVITVAEVLKNRGYATAAVVGSVTLEHEKGLDRGFDLYDDTMTSERERPARDVRAAAGRWLERQSGGGFFLFVHFWDPHDPYQPPAPYETMFTTPPGPLGDLYRPLHTDHIRLHERYPGFAEAQLPALIARETDLYDGEVRYVDDELGRLIAQLQRRGLWERALVIITGDHGESLGERGWWGHELFYEEQARVPMLVKLPAEPASPANPAARVVVPTVRSIDIAPTIAEWAGARALPAEGASLGEFLASSGSGSSRTAYMERRDYPSSMRAESPEQWGRGREFAIRTDDWKLVYKQHERGELYDLKADPHELTNRIASDVGTAQELQTRLGEWIGKLPREEREAIEGMDARTIEQLRALGYIR